MQQTYNVRFFPSRDIRRIRLFFKIWSASLLVIKTFYFNGKNIFLHVSFSEIFQCHSHFNWVSIHVFVPVQNIVISECLPIYCQRGVPHHPTQDRMFKSPRIWCNAHWKAFKLWYINIWIWIYNFLDCSFSSRHFGLFIRPV